MKFNLAALILAMAGLAGCQLPPASPIQPSKAVAPIAPTPLAKPPIKLLSKPKAMPPLPGATFRAASSEPVFRAAGFTMPVFTNRFPRTNTNYYRLGPVRLLSDGTNSVVIWWKSYSNWTAQWSADMTAWTTLSSGTTRNTNSPVVVVDYDTGRLFPMKFYRLIPTP